MKNHTRNLEKLLVNCAEFADSFGDKWVNEYHLLGLALMGYANTNLKKHLEKDGFDNINISSVTSLIYEARIKDPKAFETPKDTGYLLEDNVEYVGGILSIANEYCKSFGHSITSVEHLIVCVLCERPWLAHYSSKIFGGCKSFYLSIESFLKMKDPIEGYYSEGIGSEEYYDDGDDSPAPIKKSAVKSDYDIDEVVSQCCTLLNKTANDPSFPKIFGREKEVSIIEEIISRKNKSNCILLGEAGVGKTSVVEGLAQLVESESYNGVLKGKDIYSLDVTSILSGTIYRGQFEAKMIELIKFFKDKKKILFIDEIHTIIGSGAKQGENDLANILKPALSRGEICCIGATTADEYKKYFESDAALSRRFQSITINEPSIDETVLMMEHSLPAYKEHHKVSCSAKTLRFIAEKCHKFLPHMKFPDKGFDVLDQSMSKARILKDKTLKESHILQTISDRTKVDIKTLSAKGDRFDSFIDNMRGKIFGQDKHLDKIFETLSCSKAGIRDEKKPVANFLFVGQTSVGKTFTAKCMAEEFYGNKRNFLQLNMSEYQDQITVSKLIGATAGYVGYEDGGILTDFVRKTPNSLILFDEIEKCHPSLLNLLLQILDEGTLIDSKGRPVDFSRCIIVMTSNIGVEKAAKPSMGFIQDNSPEESFGSSIAQYLRPELVSRLDDIIIFDPLSKEAYISIVKDRVIKISQSLEKNGISFSNSDNVYELVYEAIGTPKHAREINKLIREKIEVPISKKILSDSPKKLSLKITDKHIQIL